ncbi:10821_t:CDS:2 [Funneliformis mosseae]|uniref:10821_t:CDS:1 n=1 Tax=Funneliformis mosseae TaxID=27381 RepID=A0A9N9F764_FUNMO|nr:10821_t:CDS:2 [Funneliformis mosseae]
MSTLITIRDYNDLNQLQHASFKREWWNNMTQTQKENQDVPKYLNTPDNRKNLHTIVYYTSTIVFISLSGCFYVFYRTYKQWKFNKLRKKSLNMIHKLPFYTACTDLLLNMILFTNNIHPMIYGYAWKGAACAVISNVNWFFVSINLSLYGTIAILTYLRICRGMFFNYGKGDYKLWSLVLFLSVIFQILNYKNHGPRKYWCTGRSGQIISTIILFVLISLTLVIILVCYASILKEVMNVRTSCYTVSTSTSSENLDDNNVESIILKNRIEIEKRASQKIMTAMGKSMGGIGNAIQYMINEGIVVSASTGLETPIIECLGITNENNTDDDVTEISKVKDTYDTNNMDKNEDSNIILNNESQSNNKINFKDDINNSPE